MPPATNGPNNSLSQLRYTVRELKKSTANFFSSLIHSIPLPHKHNQAITSLATGNNRLHTQHPGLSAFPNVLSTRHRLLLPTPKRTPYYHVQSPASPKMTVLPCAVPRLSHSTQTTISNWAKPVVPEGVFPQLLSPAPNLAVGHWPLPQPSLKTAPCKKNPRPNPLLNDASKPRNPSNCPRSSYFGHRKFLILPVMADVALQSEPVWVFLVHYRLQEITLKTLSFCV